MKIINSKPKHNQIIFPFYKYDVKRLVEDFCHRYNVTKPYIVTVNIDSIKFEWFHGHQILVLENAANLSQIIFDIRISHAPFVREVINKSEIFFKIHNVMLQYNLHHYLK